MKILTTNFLTCAVKSCKSSSLSFPLHFRDATLERTTIDFSSLFIRNILPRVNWTALKTTADELGLSVMVPAQNPVEVAEEGNKDDEAEMETGDAEEERKGGADDDVLQSLHTLLLETSVVDGKLVCGNCGFEYPIKEGVANFLLPAHLV
ncbi:hypothetical protein H2200_010308 [Cladophialophora chaetospira]|uniref:Multifunctional methyltransferase subunit trm112 n=1 Tax=Cladophialophora chaetospira TaxID=386627 RepID=A0AA38X187_9EURO|nr:hypothetical protein H2200_010308 [Cladophialophora chaetospira]